MSALRSGSSPISISYDLTYKRVKGRESNRASASTATPPPPRNFGNIKTDKTDGRMKCTYQSMNAKRNIYNHIVLTITITNYSQQEATFLEFTYFYRHSTCFRRFPRPSSGAHNCTYSFRHCQPILLLAATVEEMETHGVFPPINRST